MATKSKLPAFIFVRKEKDGNEEYLLAFEKTEDVIEEDGPTVFARYDLSEEYVGTKKGPWCLLLRSSLLSRQTKKGRIFSG